MSVSVSYNATVMVLGENSTSAHALTGMCARSMAPGAIEMMSHEADLVRARSAAATRLALIGRNMLSLSPQASPVGFDRPPPEACGCPGESCRTHPKGTRSGAGFADLGLHIRLPRRRRKKAPT